MYFIGRCKITRHYTKISLTWLLLGIILIQHYELPHISEIFSYFTSSGIILYPTDTVKYLGVIISSYQSRSPHIGTLVSRARSVASWVLLSVLKTRARPTMLTLYKSLVWSHLEYFCPLWNPTKIGDIQQLKSVHCSKNVHISHIWGEGSSTWTTGKD